MDMLNCKEKFPLWDKKKSEYNKSTGKKKKRTECHWLIAPLWLRI
jgi:hypothetical protein